MVRTESFVICIRLTCNILKKIGDFCLRLAGLSRFCTNCVLIPSLKGSAWTLRMICSSCSQMGCHQRSLTGWRPPSLRGSADPCGAWMKSPSFAALCMLCKLGYLWRGIAQHIYLTHISHELGGFAKNFCSELVIPAAASSSTYYWTVFHIYEALLPFYKTSLKMADFLQLI